MPLRIEIPDEDVKDLTESAKRELESQTKIYCNRIIKEAGRLEGSLSGESHNSEITAIFIKQASISNKSPWKKKKSIGVGVVQTISSLTTFFAGLLFQFDKFKTSEGMLIGFLVLALIAIISTVAMHMMGDNKS